MSTETISKQDQFAVLNAMLKRLAGYYTDPKAEEIAINQPGELWIKNRRPKEGEPIWTRVVDDHLTFDYLHRVFRVVANSNNLPFGSGTGQTPAVYASLPGGHRFSVRIPTMPPTYSDLIAPTIPS